MTATIVASASTVSTFSSERPDYEYDERSASLAPPGTGPYIRPPPPPHLLSSPITRDAALFQTIHMGAPTVSLDKYRLVVTGLVAIPLTLTLDDIKALPATTITSFHECYGPPTLPPTINRWRIGNVKWTGVRLSHLLENVRPRPEAKYVWSDGLDSGTFANMFSDRYRKDLPISKAMSEEVLLAYAMNDEPLSKERGGPVRLVVPGWFGTNSTKWLCRLDVRERRATGAFVERWYNEEIPATEDGELGWDRWDGNVLWEKQIEREGRKEEVKMRPVWRIPVNSMIVRPKPDQVFTTEKGGEETEVEVEGWAWSDPGIASVEVSVDEGTTWVDASVEERTEYSWQKFRRKVMVGRGEWKVIARAECKSGMRQPLDGRRNHVHCVTFGVE